METAYSILGFVHLLRGQPEEARLSFARFKNLAGFGDYARLFLEAVVEHPAGNATAAQEAAEEFERRFCVDDPLSCAQITAWRGETDVAFAWLDQADLGYAGDPGDDTLISKVDGSVAWGGRRCFEDPLWMLTSEAVSSTCLDKPLTPEP